MQRSLQKNWAENDMLEEPETEPIYSCPDDCGRKHLSLSAACARANLRLVLDGGESSIEREPMK